MRGSYHRDLEPREPRPLLAAPLRKSSRSWAQWLWGSGLSKPCCRGMAPTNHSSEQYCYRVDESHRFVKCITEPGQKGLEQSGAGWLQPFQTDFQGHKGQTVSSSRTY